MLYQGPRQGALQAIIEAAARTLQVERVSVWLYTQDRDVLECVDLYELSENRHSDGNILEGADFPVYFRALAEERLIVAHDAHQDSRTSEFSESYLKELGIASMLDAPIRVEGELIGVVCHEHVGNPRTWEQEDASFASSIANRVSLAIEAGHRRQAEQEREDSEIRYRNLFEGSPISLWQEDYSQTKALLEDIHARGVEDMEAYLHDHPEDVEECIRRIRIIDVNQASLTMHRADSTEEFVGSLSRIIPPQARDEFIPQLLAVWNGETFYEGTNLDHRLDGSEMRVAIRWTAAPGYEQSLARALVSKIDITESFAARESLEQALNGTIAAIGMTTETRDPYTAGHQRCVTELAVAIAEKLQFDPDTIEGTRVAGLVHDIGKLAIPAEILSKPSALNAMEFALIQSHPQAAYDILQTIVFPWPIAQIVLQHHERMDGTGYPNGLAKDDIRMEARILAVADTVEAMASHRPYRPALGIDRALEEIEKSRGSGFDSAIVEACLELFRHEGFAFSV